MSMSAWVCLAIILGITLGQLVTDYQLSKTTKGSFTLPSVLEND
jgi:Na+/H+-dicarboxylate symporter